MAEPSAPPDTTKYPEHEKLHKIKDQSQIIGEFLEWLSINHMVVASYGDNDWLEPVSLTITGLLALYFKIDSDRLEDEKMSMLDILRHANENTGTIDSDGDTQTTKESDT